MSHGASSALPAGWATAALGDIANEPVARLGAAGRESFVYVDISSIDNDAKRVVAPKTVSADRAPSRAQQNLRAGDVVVSMTRPNLNAVAIVDSQLDGAVASTGLHVLRSDTVQPGWLYLSVQTRQFVESMCDVVQGALYPAVRPKDIDSWPCRVPPLNEQRRIVDLVDELLPDLDEGVAALERARARLKLYRAAVLKAAVEGALTADWRARHPEAEPASELLQRILVERRRRWESAQLAKYAAAGKPPPKNWKAKYKQPVAPDTADLPALPDGWCWASMAQLAWSSGYGTSQKCRESNSGLPVLRIPNIANGRLDLNNLKFAPADYVEPDVDFVGVGDLLVIRTNGSRNLIGRGAVVCDRPELHLGFASYLIRLRLVPFASLLKWIAFVWDSFGVRHLIETEAATSAGQYNISLGVLEKVCVPVPPEAEQSRVVDVLDQQFSVIDRLDADLAAKLQSAQGLRQAILRDAFAGRLVPQDPHDEPATELLKRIAAARVERERAAKAAKKTGKATRRGTRPSRAARRTAHEP